MPTTIVNCSRCDESTKIQHGYGADILYCPVCGKELSDVEVSNDE